MNSLFVIFGLAVYFVAIGAQKIVDVSEGIQIAPSDIRRIKSSIGVVYGAKSCGGFGKFVEWRMEGCDSTDSICQLPANGTVRRSELDFIPSEDIEQLGLRLILSVDGTSPEMIYQTPLHNSTVTGGQLHTKSCVGKITEEFSGKNVTAQYILFRMDEEMTTEICAEADFQFI